MSARFRPLIRMLLAVFCTSFAVALIAATPAPFSSGPTVVVFPFKTADGLDASNGRDYALALGNALLATGGIRVVMGDPATASADFLKVTAANDGDYYLTGFMSAAVNGTSSVLEQLVSRRSGTAIWGATAQIATGKDVQDQGPIVHDAVMQYAGRGFYAIINATPTPTPTKTPKGGAKKNGISTSGGGGGGEQPRRTLDLPNEAYGFSSAPTAKPKLYASSAHPARFAVLAVTGPGGTAERNYIESSLVTTLARFHQPALPGDPEQTRHWLIHPADTCAQTGAAYLVFGTIATHSSDASTGVDPWTDATYTPMVYDCAAQAYNRAKPIHGSAFDWKTAVDRAVIKATTDFFAKLPGAASNRA